MRYLNGAIYGIEQIRQREQQATQGPWRADDIGAGTVAVGVVAASGQVIVDHDFISAHDAEFVAHAREDIPHLLNLWDTRDAALRTLVEQLKSEAEAVPLRRTGDLGRRDALVRSLLTKCADALDAILKETTP